MATIRTTCPHCQSVQAVEDVSLTGAPLSCPQCSASYTPTPLPPAGTERRFATEADVPEVWQAGDVLLNLYEVRGELGRGGMGAVYRVHHRNWNLDLAVKSPLAKQLAREGGAENFEREAETWVNLGFHPHVVSCHYVRRLGGIPRVFAEYIDGCSLHDWIRGKDGTPGELYEGGPEASLPRILDIAIQFAWGLHHSHEKGLVHQDVKPANVMMTRDGIAKMTDFGLARVRATAQVAPALPPAGRQSIPVSVGGMTPAYCSPEQANREPLSRRTDIWSWAVSMLEMFKGEVTWYSGAVAGEALELIVQEGPQSPEYPPMPDGVVEVLRKCFRRDPNERPRDMLAVVDSLRRVYQELAPTEYPREAPKAVEAALADQHNNRAISLLDLGKAEEAEKEWAMALKIDPKHFETTFNQGLTAWRHGRITDDVLVTELQQLAIFHPDNSTISYLIAQVHLECGNVQMACDELARASTAAEAVTENQALLAAAQTWSKQSRKSINTVTLPLILKSRLLGFDVSGNFIFSVSRFDAQIVIAWFKSSLAILIRLISLFLGILAVAATISASTVGLIVMVAWLTQVNSLSTVIGFGVLSAVFIFSVSLILYYLYQKQFTRLLIRPIQASAGRLIIGAFLNTKAASEKTAWYCCNVFSAILLHIYRPRVFTVWDLRTLRPYVTQGWWPAIAAAIFHPDGVALLTVTGEYLLEWDWRARKVRRVTPWSIETRGLGWWHNLRNGAKGKAQLWCISGINTLFCPDGVEEGADLRPILHALGAGSRGGGGVCCADLASGSKWFAVVDTDQTITIWDRVTLACFRRFPCPGGVVTALSLSPNGEYCLTGQATGILRIWETATGRCLWTSRAHLNALAALGWSFDGHHAWSVDDRGIVNRWQIRDGNPAPYRAPLLLSGGMINTARIYANQNIINHNIGLATEAVKMCDSETVFRYLQRSRSMHGYKYHHEIMKLWITIYDSMYRKKINDHISNRMIEKCLTPIVSVHSGHGAKNDLAINLDNHLLYLCSWPRNRRPLFSTVGNTAIVQVEWGPSRQWCLSRTSGGTVYIRVLDGDSPTTEFSLPTKCSSASMHCNGQWVVTGEGRAVIGWAKFGERWEIIRTFTGLIGGENCAVAWSPDGLYVASGNSVGQIRLWHWETGRQQVLHGSTLAIRQVAWSEDQRGILAITTCKKIQIWVRKPRWWLKNCWQAHYLKPDSGPVTTAAWSPDSRFILSGSQDGTVKLWEVATGQCVYTNTSHTGPVTCVAWSPDAGYYLSGGADGTVRKVVIDWELEALPAADWDEAARPYLTTFLTLHTPYAAELPIGRQPTPKEVTLALTRQGKPTWTEEDFQKFLRQLGCAGFGHLRPEGVRRELEKTAARWKGPPRGW